MKNHRWGRWFKEVEITLNDFANWVNQWGDVERYAKYEQKEKQASYRRGYQKAMSNVWNKLGLNYKRFDKRTKTKYRKELKK
jgi:hypothetical protein